MEKNEKRYRYMSEAEYAKLVSGETVVGNRHDDCETDSVGACFLAEATEIPDGKGGSAAFSPEDCYRFLEGVVSDELLVEFDVLRPGVLREGYGVYADPFSTDFDATVTVAEWSAPEYSLNDLRPVRVARRVGGLFGRWEWER